MARANAFCFKLAYINPKCKQTSTCFERFHALIGGGRANFDGEEYHKSTESLSVSNWTWHQTQDFPYKIAYAAGVETSAGNFVIGGKFETSSESASVWQLIFGKNCLSVSWVKTGYILSIGRYHHAATVLQGNWGLTQCKIEIGMFIAN